MGHYHAFGLKIESELLLPELYQGSGPADVVISFATAESDVKGEVAQPWLDGSGDRVTLRLEGIRFEIEDGRIIRIAPPPGTADADIRVWLLGSVMATLLYQRGYFALHANTVRIPAGGAAAFSGVSGAGKSTLAGLLDRGGLDVLGDDLCAIRFEKDGSPFLYDGIPRLKLWERTLRLLGRDPSKLEKVTHDLAKFHVPLERSNTEGALQQIPLQRLYLLGRKTRMDEPLIQRMSGAAAAEAVLDNAFRWGIGQSVRGEGSRSQFDQAIAIARNCEVYRVARTWSEASLFIEADAIEAHLRETQVEGQKN